MNLYFDEEIQVEPLHCWTEYAGALRVMNTFNERIDSKFGLSENDVIEREKLRLRMLKFEHDNGILICH